MSGFSWKCQKRKIELLSTGSLVESNSLVQDPSAKIGNTSVPVKVSRFEQTQVPHTHLNDVDSSDIVKMHILSP